MNLEFVPVPGDPEGHIVGHIVEKSALPQLGVRPPLSDHDRGWLEALIDSEGYLKLCRVRDRRHTYWRLDFSVTNTNKAFIERAREIVGGRVRFYDAPTKPKNKPWYVLRWRSTIARNLLPQLRLIVKERRRILAIEALAIMARHSHRYSDDQKQRLAEIGREFVRLNQRGRASKLEKLPEVAEFGRDEREIA